ncbi:MAG: NAD(P)/FAD-dependent oxidoreductase [Sedimentisphaerales bacterium]|jgi:predicted Rossmann fold flavoprotein
MLNSSLLFFKVIMVETDICIIGAGPAGLMAAIVAGENSKKIVIFESNTTAGRKLLLTGRGRCNITHTGKPDEIIRAFKPFDRFVRHCIYELPPQKLRDFFAQRGLDTVAEEDGCVFPKSQRASDVNQILLEELDKLNIRIFYGKKVKSIEKRDEHFAVLSEKLDISAKSVIIATGGLSWPQTGSTGDGYKFAQMLGHKIITPAASVVPLVAAEKFCSDLAGVGIGNVLISCKIDNKKFSYAGPLIFTHKGIGGPAVFDLSREIAGLSYNNLKIHIDLLPAIKELDKTVADLIGKNPKRNIISLLSQFLPKALIQTLCTENRIPEIEAGQINKQMRKTLIDKLKNLPLTIISAEPIEKATVTRGGVDISEIDSKTMQSKLCKGLFFAGEVINVDGPCGGYNLQFAFSSGFLAGKSALKQLE